MRNVDAAVVADFGKEWSIFDQSRVSEDELQQLFGAYFSLFPFNALPWDARGIDIGCGSGRWARLVAPRVAELHCLDASEAALRVARRTLAQQTNCRFHHASVDAMPIPDGSMDFAYSLGVLDHVPHTPNAIQSCVEKLKPGAPFLLYLYYDFENRPWWYRATWSVSDVLRRAMRNTPYPVRYAISQAIAALVYYPCARTVRVAQTLGWRTAHSPLSFYADKSFYTMRTDALDRFGTRLEKRFSRERIRRMMLDAGLTDVRFSESMPYWCALGYKRGASR